MKCSRCGYEFEIKLGARIVSKGAKILTAMTTIVTAQCEQCGQIFQVPVASKSFFTVKKENKKN
ncbi:MAG: hypothetical protein AABW91_02660 [Nanoarchaeota archaeon]